MDMSKAFSEHNYDGVFTYFSGDDLATLRIVHMVIDDVERERLVHLNGAPREIIRNGGTVECILMPGDRLLDLEIPEGPFARAFVRRFDQLSGHYGVSLRGEDRIAGRPTFRLAVEPNDTDRFGYRLWLDQETKLLLKSELVDSDGERLEIFQFNTIVLDAQVAEEALASEQDGGSVISHLQLAGEVSAPMPSDQMNWHTGWLPPGFSMAAADMRLIPDKLKTVATMMYSDGLATFSLFVEDMPEQGASTSMVSRNGATVAVTHLVEGRDARQSLVTLVGELPTLTAQKIAQSVYYQRSP
jgi:sigma-E factor negative regulatory protein RseB